MDVNPAAALVINAPEFFEDQAFMAWLNSASAKFTWHVKGNSVADEYSDVVVCVDPSLNGEGTDSDMPEHIWQKIVETCRAHLGVRSGEYHYMVRLTNLATSDRQDAFDRYEALPASYHTDPRWDEVAALRETGKHAEANGLVGTIRSAYGFE